MVRAENRSLADQSGTEGLRFVVELIGPAAAGKTTLSQVLIQSNEEFVKGTEIGLRRIWPIPLFVGNALFLAPTLLQEYRNGGGFGWNEIKMIVGLNGWKNVLGRQAVNGRTIVLDHGPVFMLTWLRRSRTENRMSLRFDQWWKKMLKQWAPALELIICLDAPEEILLERRHARNRSRIERGEKSGQEAAQSLVRYRRTLDFESTISAMMAIKATRLLRFDTDQYSVSQIANEVMAALDFGQTQGSALGKYTSRD